MNEKLMSLNIVTPEKNVFSDDIQAVWLPGAKSPFEVLRNHAPIVSGLTPGKIKIRKKDGDIVELQSGKGFAEVSNNEIVVLTETATEKD